VPDAPASYVYFIRAGGDGPIKIGTTAGSPHGRLRAMQTANAETLVLLAAVPGDVGLERKLHERFAALRMRGEWFRATPELLAFVEGASLTAPPVEEGIDPLAGLDFTEHHAQALEGFLEAWWTLKMGERLLGHVPFGEAGGYDAGELPHGLVVALGDALSDVRWLDGLRARQAPDGSGARALPNVVPRLAALARSLEEAIEGHSSAVAECRLAEAAHEGFDPCTDESPLEADLTAAPPEAWN
jgi:hypothetical protein